MQTQTLQELAIIIVKILLSDRDAFICVTGETGEGKSVLAIHLARLVSKLTKHKFDFGTNLVYSRQALYSLIEGDKRLPEYSTILADELINITYRRDWATKEQKILMQLFDMCRDRHLLVIGCVPLITTLDKHLLNSKMRLWVHVHKRGQAWVFIRDNNPCSTDSWNINYNEKMWYKGGVRKFKNYIGNLHYPDLDPKTKEEYLKHRNVKRREAKEEMEGEQTDKASTTLKLLRKHRAMLLSGLSKIERVDMERVALSLRIPYKTVKRLIKEFDEGKYSAVA